MITQRRSPAILERVTHQSVSDYTCITLELNQRVTWRAQKLAPEKGQKNGRIFIDLAHTRLGSSVQNVVINDQQIAGVRLGQYKPDVARVVLDTANFDKYRVYSHAEPDRLTIYVWNARTAQIPVDEPLESKQQLKSVDAKQKVPTPASTDALRANLQENGKEIAASGSDKGNAGKGRNSKALAETLLLDITINTRPLAEIVRAERLADGRLALPLETWQAARLRLPVSEPLLLPEDQRGYALESVPGLVYDLDRSRMVLTVTAPPVAFTGTVIDSGRGNESPPNLSPPGFYFNYDSSITSADNRYDRYGAIVEGVAFNRWGSVVAGMILRGDRQGDEAVRADSFWRKDLPGPMETLVLGDTVGSGGAWSRPVRYGGIRWARDFSLRPGFITMPMPTLSGSAALPSTVDVLINNQRQQNTQVEPGPFELTNVPVVSGAGEVNLVVRDLLGRESIISQSYYVSPRLLANGLVDFSLEAGALRKNYGSKSNDYGNGFAAGTWRYGLSGAVTGGTRIELQEQRQAAGVDFTALIGTLGAMQAAAAFTSTDGVLGGHYLFGMEHTSPYGGGSLRGEYFDRDFTQFAFDDGESRPRQIFSVSLGMPLFRTISVGGNYTSQTTWEGDRFTIVSANMGMSLPWDMNVSVYASKRLNSSNEWSGGVNLSKSLGSQRTASARTSHDNNGRTINTVELSQSLPPGPGTGWRLRASDDQNQQWNAGISWNTNVGNVNAEATDSTDSVAIRLGANGSFGLMAGLPFATRNIGQGSFAVVKVGDLQGVPVYNSNQLVAITNSSGLALVPGLLPFQKNQLTIDPVELPFDIEIGGVREVPVPYARSGMFVDFPVRRSRNALLLLYKPDGTPVPAGARVQLSPGEQQFIVGKRGEVYLMNLSDSNQASVQWQGGGCYLGFSLDPKGPREPLIGPLSCGGTQP